MDLPEEIKHPQEIWIPTSIDVCTHLGIDHKPQEFRIDYVLEQIKKTSPELDKLMKEYFDAYERWSLSFHSLQRNEKDSSLEEYNELLDKMLDAKNILYKNLN